MGMARGKFTDIEKEAIGLRISALAKEKGVNAAEIGRACDVTRATAGNWLKGTAVPDIGNAEPLGVLLGVHYRYLIYGDTESLLIGSSKPAYSYTDGDELGDDDVLLPLLKYLDEVGNIDMSTCAATRRVSKQLLAELNVPVESGYYAHWYGDSMEPQILDGSIIGINTAAKKVHDGCVYAIDQGGLVRLRRLHNTPQGYRIESYNPAYPDEHATTDELVVVGQMFSSEKTYRTG